MRTKDERIQFKRKMAREYTTVSGDSTSEQKLFDGTVPGCAHTDLLRDGLIPDYMLDYNVDESRFIENSQFSYWRTFNLEGEHACTLLTFECLDTFCDIFVNGLKATCFSSRRVRFTR